MAKSAKEPNRVLGVGLTGLLVLVGLALGLGIGYRMGPGSAKTTKTDMPESVSHEEHGPKATKTLYTCGMDPDVISETPGTCPKCGMKLVPMDKDRAAMILEARGESVPESTSSKDRKILYWRAPMDPTYIRDQPGKSPMGMDLVPVYEDDVAGGPTIRIDPVTEQNMGLRYDVVRVGPLKKTVRTVGTVDYDEQGLGTVTTKTDGWVEKVYVEETGTQVHPGDPLFDVYSRELFSAQQEYLIALSDQKHAEDAGQTQAAALAKTRVDSARERLRFFDINDDQINEIVKQGQIRKTLTITAQLTGIVTKRNVKEGDFLKAGQPAYEIADLSNIWVIGKVYESDLPFVKLGQEAQMKLDYLPGRTYRGRLTYIYPYLEKGTREITVRMEFHNPGYELKPGMYATLELQSIESEKAVLVPDMAVIDTGERKVVFVQREPGKFAPRQVETGLRTDDDELQVFSGLAPGEKVVVSGQFLLDSESRLREATLKMLKPGMQNTSDFLKSATPEENMAGMSMPSAEKTNEPGPQRYVCPMPSHAGILYDDPGNCPLCGMKLVPIQPWQTKEQVIDHYTCPMPEHYSVHSDKPGKCPLCGMTLIPVTKAEMARFAEVKNLPVALYTCPMPAHADVVSDEPGTCPRCGMKLVPTESVPHGTEAVEHWHEKHDATATVKDASGSLVLYTCPMESDADVVSDEPGQCPKCGMALVPTSSVEHGQQSAKHWHDIHDATATVKDASDALVLYTCPMESDADVVSDEPGQCPKCGMALVPTSSVDHGKQSEEAWKKAHH